jgi:predicted DNA binding protein
VTLSELAEQFEITDQAASERLRHALNNRLDSTR